MGYRVSVALVELHDIHADADGWVELCGVAQQQGGPEARLQQQLHHAGADVSGGGGDRDLHPAPPSCAPRRVDGVEYDDEHRQ